MLKGRHVSLFAVEKEDLQQLRDWRNNPDFRKHFREYRELNLAQPVVVLPIRMCGLSLAPPFSKEKN